MRKLLALLAAVLARMLIFSIRGYQLLISPWLGPRCRFTPTCSEYMLQAIGKYGPIVGCWQGMRRIAKCHPWHPGGHDPVE